MNIKQVLRVVKDFFNPNRYELDAFLIRGGEKKPFALILPGGGYEAVCTENEGIPYAEELNKLGYSAFVLSYRVRKKAKFPAPLDDAARAVRYITENAENLGVRVNGYSVWGSSAGGHLAGAFASKTIGYKKYGLPKPAAVILAYPVVTMGEFTHEGSKVNLIGRNATQEMIDKTSVEKLVDGDYPAVYVWYSDADKTVDPKNSIMLSDALKRNGVRHICREYNTPEHGIGLGKGSECEPWFAEAVRFWEEETQK